MDMMNTLCALLLIGQVYIDPNPRVPGGYIVNMPISPKELANPNADNDLIFQQVSKQPWNWESVAERYPIRSAAPVPDPNFNDTSYTAMRDRQQRDQELETQEALRRAQLSRYELDQTLARKKAEYDDNINTQANEAMHNIGKLDPSSPDFNDQVSDFLSQYPLSAEHPAVRSAVDALQRQNAAIASRNDIRDRQRENRDAAFRNTQENIALGMMGKLGPQALARYNDELQSKRQAKDANPDLPEPDPVKIAAKYGEEYDRAILAGQLINAGIPQDKIMERFTSKDPLTGAYVFNTELAKQTIADFERQQKQQMTPQEAMREYRQWANAKREALASDRKWSDADEAILKDLASKIPVAKDAQPTIPTSAHANLLFGKKSGE